MVHEKLSGLLEYIPSEKKDLVTEFLNKISVDMEEGFYAIDGENIYAKVMSYNTKLPEECEIEAHDCYVDIQFTLNGEEGISIYPREDMKLVNEDTENDFLIFENHLEKAMIGVRNKPGWFTLIHTYEAHRPQESVNRQCELVKKGVIKIKEIYYE